MTFLSFRESHGCIYCKNQKQRCFLIMAEQFFMTKKGYDEAVSRLKYLQTEKRQEVVARIQEARSHGDLSENAEYDAARSEQSAVEG